MSKEWIHKTLVNLGFKETDAQVYFYLTTKGFQNARNIAEALELHRAWVYRVLKNLHNKGIIDISFEHPAHFSAVPFEKVLELLNSVKSEHQKVLQDSRDELLSAWQSITKKDTGNNAA